MTPDRNRKSASPPTRTDSEPGVLYVVATPLGNLDDISERAINVLRDVDLILCEDTRRTRTLLTRYGISQKCLSYHDHNERQRAPAITVRIQKGESMALVSDAGTPMISDPGYHLLTSLTEAGIAVIPIPGPSSVTALLSVAGLPADRFVFEGFLPVRSGKRSRRISELTDERRTLVFFESPHRIGKTLTEMHLQWGDRRACVGREMTKKFEDIRHGSLGELAVWANSSHVKGEVILAVAGADKRSRPRNAE